jgi:hypothetical protein
MIVNKNYRGRKSSANKDSIEGTETELVYEAVDLLFIIIYALSDDLTSLCQGLAQSQLLELLASQIDREHLALDPPLIGDHIFLRNLTKLSGADPNLVFSGESLLRRVCSTPLPIRQCGCVFVRHHAEPFDAHRCPPHQQRALCRNCTRA